MNNLLILSCKWYINTFKNLPIIVLMKNIVYAFQYCQYIEFLVFILSINFNHVMLINLIMLSSVF